MANLHVRRRWEGGALCAIRLGWGFPAFRRTCAVDSKFIPCGLRLILDGKAVARGIPVVLLPVQARVFPCCFDELMEVL